MKSLLQTAAALVALVALWPPGALGQAPLCPVECSCESFHSIYCTGGATQPPVGYWPQVTTLSVYNKVSVLHKYSLSGFPRLTHLHLTGNELTEVDFDAFAPLTELLYLYLDGNRIRSLGSPPAGSFVELLSLRYIHVENNEISSMHPDILQMYAPQLYYLYMSANPLVVNEGEAVMRHSKVEFVDLRNSSSLYAGAGSFSGLTNVRQIVLDYSGVSAVTSGALPAGVHRILLRGTTLQRFDASAAIGLLAGGGVHIDDTPLACACAYDSLYWYALGKFTVYATCFGQNSCAFTRRAQH